MADEERLERMVLESFRWWKRMEAGEVKDLTMFEMSWVGKGYQDFFLGCFRKVLALLPRLEGEWPDACKDLRDTLTRHYEGFCPRCVEEGSLRNYPYCNTGEHGRTAWFYCEYHRTCWCAGENLFSSRYQETEADWKRNGDRLQNHGYKVVEPVGHIDSDGE